MSDETCTACLLARVMGHLVCHLCAEVGEDRG